VHKNSKFEDLFNCTLDYNTFIEYTRGYSTVHYILNEGICTDYVNLYKAVIGKAHRSLA